MAEVLFWICVVLVLHTYLLYPLLLCAASAAVQTWRDWRYIQAGHDRRSAPLEDHTSPAVSVIIPAHNEEHHLPQKLENLHLLDYPKDLLEIIFISDGSTDGTNAILAAAEGGNIAAVYVDRRRGKANALNVGVGRSRHGILVFCDTATIFEPDAIRKLVQRFADPRVGVVAGALQFHASVESRQTEGLYWRYESMLRLMESRLGLTLTASGAIYALRRECFVPLAVTALVEDLVVPLNARKQGFHVVYEPAARAIDFAPATVAGEFARRVRIATGSFRALGEILRGPLDLPTAFAFVSHKLLRWVVPFLLIGILVTSATLWSRPLYRALLLAQAVFYAWGIAGWLLRRQIQGVRYALLAYYLLAMHLAFLVGFVRFLSRRADVGWRRVS